MKKITAFYLEGCPYCKQARDALKELINENENYSQVQLEWIDEDQHPEISERFNYYYVPSMFIDDKKIYEAHKGESFNECKENIKRVLEAASN